MQVTLVIVEHSMIPVQVATVNPNEAALCVVLLCWETFCVLFHRLQQSQ